MGILNATSDSFYPGSRVGSVSEGLARARSMIHAGADVLDIGGESTRPGSDSVDAEEEHRRVIPLIRAIRQESEVPISIDTRKSRIAEAALDAGADMVNDVSALRDDPDLSRVVAERGVPVVLMHMKGTPKTMQHSPHYDDTVKEIRDELSAFVDGALDAGIAREQIILDPGIGFGKRVEDNLRILQQLHRFRELGYPLLLGASRKSFIGAVLKRTRRAAREARETGEGPTPDAEEPNPDVDERLAGTLGVHAFAISCGVKMIRVHDVQESVDLRAILAAIAEV